MSAELPEVAVWDYKRQTFVPHFPCSGEKRVRIDVHDDLSNYAVFKVTRPDGQQPYQAGRIVPVELVPVSLRDWRIDLS
jgi:hypothetical protein